MVDDFALLRSYATDRSEDAFAELVKRYAGFVYFAVLRQVGGDRQLAEDVSQEVFAALALDANKVSGSQVLAGWLYSTARHKAAHAVESIRRRKGREQKAYMTDELLTETNASSNWEMLSPMIDDALSELNPPQRDLVLLRFFHGLPFADIGARLGISTEAARFRLDRALEKMRRHLRKRGVSSTVSALALALEAPAKAAAPDGLAFRISSGALAKVAAAKASAGSMASMLQFMISTKTMLGAALIIGASTIGFVIYERSAQREQDRALLASQEQVEVLSRDLSQLRQQLATAQKSQADLQSAVASSARKRNGSAAGRSNGAGNTSAPASRNSAKSPSADPNLANDPQVKQATAAMTKSLFARRYTHLFNTLGFNPERTAEMLDLMVQASDGVSINGTTVSFRPDGVSEERVEQSMSALWGSASAEQAYAEYNRTYLVREVATDLAGNLYDTATPLTAAQSDQLTQILANSTSSYQSGGTATKTAINWDSAVAQAQGILSEPQFEVLQNQATLLASRVWYTGGSLYLRPSIFNPSSTAK